MRAGTSKGPGKDEVLRPVLAAHAHDRDPRWRAILLAIFHPGLVSLHARKRRWDGDRGDRWQNTVLVFLQVVARLDLAKRSTRLAQEPPDHSASVVVEARSYVTTLTLQRLHQATFRQRVLMAYQEECAICRLRHTELLEAARILTDGHPRGEPIVANGVALCTLHHAAFDRYILGIRPDLVIETRADILEEHDGPMLRHGLQEVAGTKLIVPRAVQNQPRREFLEERYERFRKAE